MTNWVSMAEIQRFREYLRIPSVHPDVNYEQCIEFLIRQANEIGLPYKIYHPAHPKKPILIMTWTGEQPDLPAIILNSHMDVVPVSDESWSHPPFAADMDDEGRIFARGSQDMKCVGMQYLEVVRSLKQAGVKLKRTILISFMPDEETGGALGMQVFVKSEDFKALNIGFALDEGIASPTDVYPIIYGERLMWHTKFRISGNSGHGSSLKSNTAGEKLCYLINKMYELRDHEVRNLEANPDLTIGDVTSVNLTVVNGGIQDNVIPKLIEVVFDIRIAITVNHIEFEQKIVQWCKEAGDGIEIVFILKEPYVQPTKIDSTNVYWLAFKDAFEQLNLKMKTIISPGGTDSRFIRETGIPAIGFSPMRNTPMLLHDHDEFLTASTYLEGITIYKKIISQIGNA